MKPSAARAWGQNSVHWVDRHDLGPDVLDARHCDRVRSHRRLRFLARHAIARRALAPRAASRAPCRARRALVLSCRSNQETKHPKESKHEDRRHFDCAISGAFGRHMDITGLGATTSRVGGGRCKMSSSGPSAISDRPRIRGYEGRSRTCVPGLPSGAWLSSVSAGCKMKAPFVGVGGFRSVGTLGGEGGCSPRTQGNARSAVVFPGRTTCTERQALSDAPNRSSSRPDPCSREPASS
jgi:hypothetical protein